MEDDRKDNQRLEKERRKTYSVEQLGYEPKDSSNEQGHSSDDLDLIILSATRAIDDIHFSRTSGMPII